MPTKAKQGESYMSIVARRGYEIHGYTNTPLHDTWISMVQRCTNKNNQYYDNYGGRGIKVCDRWRNSFLSFLEDMGERPDGMSIDRIDVDGDYTPENCRWATWNQQMRNRRDNQRPDVGIYHLPSGKWAAGITNNNKKIHLGHFSYKHDAIKARKIAEQKYWG